MSLSSGWLTLSLLDALPISGNAAESALMWPIIQGVILVLGSLLYMAIAERFNRRLLLIVGGLVMGASFLLPAIINSVMPNADPMMIVVFLSIYVARSEEHTSELQSRGHLVCR